MANSILAQLNSLGCNFAVPAPEQPADPEKTILQALAFFWSDKKIFTMTIGLVKYKIHHLLNTNRLWILSEEFDDDRKALLAVLALKVFVHTKDVRYLKLHKKIRKQCQKISRIPPQYQDSFYIARRGVDKEFRKIGANIANFFDDQPEKKFKTLKKIYLENTWLKLRGLIGCEYRADTIFLIKSAQVTTQIEAARLIGCNKSSISRIWSSLHSIDDLIFAL